MDNVDIKVWTPKPEEITVINVDSSNVAQVAAMLDCDSYTLSKGSFGWTIDLVCGDDHYRLEPYDYVQIGSKDGQVFIEKILTAEETKNYTRSYRVLTNRQIDKVERILELFYTNNNLEKLEALLTNLTKLAE